jgi:hypothetical protein
LADEVGVDAPLVECLLDIFRRALPQIGERDVASIIEIFEPEAKAKSPGGNTR